MQETGVEFLVNHLIEYGYDLLSHSLEIEKAKKIEKQQSEEFAIGFAEWLDTKYYQGDNVNQYHRSLNEYREGKYFTVKKLLEIYKKEQGL